VDSLLCGTRIQTVVIYFLEHLFFLLLLIGGLLLRVPFHGVLTNKWMSSNVWKSSLYWMAFMNLKVNIIHNFYHNTYILYRQIQFKNGWMTSIHLDVIQMLINMLHSWMKYIQPKEFRKSDCINL
jgi:hypothetical protein